MPFSESRQGKVLRIFVGDSDRHESRPVYEVLVEKAREHGLAGATVLHGMMGYGAHSCVHTASILRLSTDLPVIIELIDLPERITSFLPVVNELVEEGMVTIEDTEVLIYRSKKPVGQR